MIKKILAVNNVGKFKSLSTIKGAETDFGQFAPILGPNAKGKSTLSAIFNSLRDGNSSAILGRRTFGTTTEQTISIEVINSSGVTENKVFTKNAWKSTYSNIEVFDNRFVAKNVYHSESINEEHERNVESVILGEEGGKLEEIFKLCDEVCLKNTNRKKEISNEYFKHLGHYGIGFPQFRNMDVDLDVTTNITNKEKQIIAHYSKNKIENALTQLEKVVDTAHLAYIQSKLSCTIETSQIKIKEHIQNHISEKRLSDEYTTNDFLLAGTKLLKPNDSENRYCSFCGQLLSHDALSLISEYEKQFSEVYKSLVDAQKQALQYLLGWKIDVSISRYVHELKALGIDLNFDQEISNILDQTSIFLKQIEKKLNLAYEIDFTSLQVIITLLEKISATILKIKPQYSAKNEPTALTLLMNEKKHLELLRERGNKIWIDLCKEYQDLEDSWKEITSKRDQALQNISNYSKKILSDYESGVNDVLKSLQADFILVETKPRGGLRRRSPLFSIAFNGTHKILLNSSTDDMPHFGNTLSESDKRLLAFAFFIACIKAKGGISDKVIILDDPVCSLDFERKDRTVVFLNKFFSIEKPKQLIILTHDRNFMALLHKRFNPQKCFMLSYSPSDMSSEIRLMKPNDEFLDDFYRQILDLKSLEYAKDADVTWDRVRQIRDVVEQIFKRKYYLRLKDQISQNGSIASFVKKLEEDKVYLDDRAKGIEDLLPHFWNHDDSTDTIARNSFSPGDLRGIVSDFFKAVEMI